MDYKYFGQTSIFMENGNLIRSAGMGLAGAALLGSVFLRVQIVREQEPFCRQNIKNSLICSLADGESPWSATHNSVVTVSGTITQNFYYVTPNLNGAEALLDLDTSSSPSAVEYIAYTPAIGKS